jgi:hypothetical protein
LPSATSILRFRAATLNASTQADDGAPTSLASLFGKILMTLLVNQEFAATDTDTLEDILHVLKELNEIHGACKAVMSEVPRTPVIGLTTASACLSIL